MGEMTACDEIFLKPFFIVRNALKKDNANIPLSQDTERE